MNWNLFQYTACAIEGTIEPMRSFWIENTSYAVIRQSDATVLISLSLCLQ